MDRVDVAEIRRRVLKPRPYLLHTGPRNLLDCERRPHTRVQRRLTAIKENIENTDTPYPFCLRDTTKSSGDGVNKTANPETPTQVEHEKGRQSQATKSDEVEDDTHSLSSGTESELRSLKSDDDGLPDEDVIVLPDEPRIPAFNLLAASKTSGEVELIPFMDQPCKELQDREVMWTAAKQETLQVIQLGMVALQRDMELYLERLSKGLDSNPDLNDWSCHTEDRQEESDPGRADGCLRGLREKLFRRKRVKEVEVINVEERQSELQELDLACKRLREEMVGRIAKAWDTMAMEKLARDKVLIAKREKAAQCFTRACWREDEPHDRLSESSQPPMSPVPYNTADDDAQTTIVVPFIADDDFRSFHVDSPMAPPPDVEYFPYRRSPRLPPIMNLSESGRKLLTGGAVVGVAPAPQKVKGKKKKAGKKQEKEEKKQQQETINEDIEKEVKKPGKKSLKERIIRWLLRKLA